MPLWTIINPPKGHNLHELKLSVKSKFKLQEDIVLEEHIE